MEPPKCKTCGKTEWQHICSPRVTIEEITATIMARNRPEPSGEPLRTILSKPTRKEYLKIKARERRARQKAAKEALK